MAERERVSPENVLLSAGAEKPVKEGTYLQRTGLRLALCVGALASFVIVALVIKWICVAPAIPAILPGTDPGTAKAIVENYKSIQQVALEPYTTLFDSVVVKVLLPVFTSILGYIFGSQRNSRNDVG